MDPLALAALRRSYQLAGLDEADVDPDPLVQFSRWLQDALAAEIAEPNAMVLATADANGRPRARTVLLKRADSAGFTFFTNHGSIKGSHLAANPQASVCFPWIALERQVIVTGAVVGVPRDEAVLYFHSRPRGSQLGAMASRQSTVIGSRGELESRFDELSQEYPEGTEVPLPDFWGGYRVVPAEVEFWQGRGNRLHDRIRYVSVGGGLWKTERLAP